MFGLEDAKIKNKSRRLSAPTRPFYRKENTHERPTRTNTSPVLNALIIGLLLTSTTYAQWPQPTIYKVWQQPVSPSDNMAGTNSDELFCMQHDAMVKVKVYKKGLSHLPWKYIGMSDPFFDGNKISIPLNTEETHAWYKLEADYTQIQRRLGLDDSQFSKLNEDEFITAAEAAGYQLQKFKDGSIILVPVKTKSDPSFEEPVKPEKKTKTLLNQATAVPIKGLVKIYWQKGSNGELAVWTLCTNGLKIAEQMCNYSASSEWIICGTGELNQDDEPDLYWRNISTGQMAYWMMQPDGQLKAAGNMGTAPKSWTICGIGKLNNDDVDDIIWRNEKDNRMLFWMMNPDGTRASVGGMGATAPADWAVCGVGDLNQDNIIDLFWHNEKNGHMAYWIMGKNGRRISSGSMGASASEDWKVFGTGDLNLDSIPDLFWMNKVDGRMAYWMMNCDGTRAEAGCMGATAPRGWTIRGVKDLNNDNITDILWQNNTDGHLAYWMMGPDGTRNRAGSTGAFASQEWTFVCTD